MLHGVAAVLVFGLGTCSHLRASRPPKGVVGGEGPTVALGKVPVKRDSPREEERQEQERKVEQRPRIITRKRPEPQTVAVSMPDQLPAELTFDDTDQDYLSPSQIEDAGAGGDLEGESRAGVPHGFEDVTRFRAYQIRFGGGDWNPDPSALPVLLRELTKRTRIPTSPVVQVVRLASLPADAADPPPFLYMTGHSGIDMSPAEIANLRAYLGRGGLLIIDDCDGFDPAVQKLGRRLFPKTPFRRIPMNHPLYHAYYPLRRILGGNVRVRPYHEGIFVHNRLAVFYSRNDLGCAWEKRPDGKFVHPCQPGGAEQREWAYRMGVNLMVYAITR